MTANHTRIAALLLTALTLLPQMTACGGDTAPVDTSADTTAAVTEAVTVDPNDRSQIKDDLPETMDLEGRQITFFVSNNSSQNLFIGGPEEATGDIVEDTVLARNAAVEERLNVDLVFNPMNEIGGDQIYGELSKLLMAGDSTNDVYIGAQYGMARTISEGGLVNVYDLEDMNFAQPWWWEVYMNELMLGDSTRFFLVGEFFIDALHNARTLYFNKNMYNRYHESSDDLYQQVLDGKWTLDQMMSLMRDVFIDVNNDGKTDNGDQLGYATYVTYSSVDAFVYATDIEFSKRNADGIVELNMMHDEAVTLAEKLVELFYMPGSYFGSTTIGGENTGLFVSGQALFLGNASLKGANALRDMKDDFGFLPYPKFDEAQESYRTLVHDAVSIGAVNGSSQNLDVLGAVLEALNAETYRSVTPTWYDTALKIKYSRDDISTEMIDLIHDSITTNFIFAYNYALDNIGLLFRTLVTNKSTDYASEVKRVEKSAQKKLDTLISVFTENQ